MGNFWGTGMSNMYGAPTMQSNRNYYGNTGYGYQQPQNNLLFRMLSFLYFFIDRVDIICKIRKKTYFICFILTKINWRFFEK